MVYTFIRLFKKIGVIYTLSNYNIKLGEWKRMKEPSNTSLLLQKVTCLVNPPPSLQEWSAGMFAHKHENPTELGNMSMVSFISLVYRVVCHED